MLGRVEADPVHGTHWLPLGLPNLLAACASAVPSRPVRGLMSLTAFASVVDDLESRGQRLRRLLPKRLVYNMVVELGDHDAPRTVVVVAHHDVARAFHPAFARLSSAPPPRWTGHREPPVVAVLAYGPAVVLAGALSGLRSLRLLGAALSALAYAIETDIGRRKPVPGANDNATGVACILELAHDLRARPAEDVRVVLVSTGAEETLLEGMQTYWARHGVHLDPADTLVVCVDTIGWKHLVLRDGEGVLRIHRSPEALLNNVTDIAAAADVKLLRRPAFGVPTDGLVARRAGVPAITLTSVAADGGAPHDHQASAEVLLHTAGYAGVPAANAAFAVAQRVLDEEGGSAARELTDLVGDVPAQREHRRTAQAGAGSNWTRAVRRDDVSGCSGCEARR